MTILVLSFDERGPIPNNPRFPVLVYRQAFASGRDDLAAAMERRFEENGWPPAWRNGIYDFHHYHSKATKCWALPRGRPSWSWVAMAAARSGSVRGTYSCYQPAPGIAGSVRAAISWWWARTRRGRAVIFCGMLPLRRSGLPLAGWQDRKAIRSQVARGQCSSIGAMGFRRPLGSSFSAGR